MHLGKPSTSGVAFPDYEIREVYKNDGKELSVSTTANVYKNRLLIGSLDSNMLYCEIKHYKAVPNKENIQLTSAVLSCVASSLLFK